MKFLKYFWEYHFCACNEKVNNEGIPTGSISRIYHHLWGYVLVDRKYDATLARHQLARFQ